MSKHNCPIIHMQMKQLDEVEEWNRKNYTWLKDRSNFRTLFDEGILVLRHPCDYDDYDIAETRIYFKRMPIGAVIELKDDEDNTVSERKVTAGFEIEFAKHYETGNKKYDTIALKWLLTFRPDNDLECGPTYVNPKWKKGYEVQNEDGRRQLGENWVDDMMEETNRIFLFVMSYAYHYREEAVATRISNDSPVKNSKYKKKRPKLTRKSYSFVSISTRKLPKQRQWFADVWIQRAHDRHYKSGKVVQIKQCVRGPRRQDYLDGKLELPAIEYDL